MVAMLLAMTGCGDETTSNNTYVTQGDNGVYIDNGDGTITYVADAYNEGQTSEDFSDEPFDASDDATECRSKGYFWCSINSVCVNQSGDGASCTGKKK